MAVKTREHWSGSLVFILAAAGSAVGLGNLWKFPYITWKNGGGYFVLLYLICILGLGIPIMIAEIAIGKITAKNPLGAFKMLAGGDSKFRIVGIMGVLGSFLILSYYSVVAGWAMQYSVYAMDGTFNGIESAKAVEYSSSLFKSFLDRPLLLVFWHTIFMALTTLIVLGGIKGGIERSVKVAMPVLFLIILFLVYNSLSLDKDFKTVKFLLQGDPSKINAHSILEAMGHAFFTLSIGMGVMITYGSYLPKNANVLANSFWVVGMDTAIAILACLMIFPIIFVYGMNPAEGGIGILFTTLPLELKKFPMGDFLLIIFYLLVVLAALTSAISLLEVVVTWFSDEKKYSRTKSVLIAAGLIYLAGLPSAYSVGTFLTLADNFTSQVLLPTGGLLIAIYTGYKMDLHLIQHEFSLHHQSKFHFKAFRFTIRYLAPILVFVVLLQTAYLFIKEAI
jgi:neurotransmitter:Na+ symporter, NSS family